MIKIANKEISQNSSTFVIAEMSANHNRDFDVAVNTIKAAKEAGADAIKFQTYTADTITLDCDNKYFQIKQDTLWDGQTLYSLYKKAYTPWDWQPKLKKIADDLGIICFSSAFDKSSVDFLERMGVPAYKVASFEITDIPLIKYIASKGKPVIISTGIAREEEIEEAVNTCKDAGNEQVILLKCTSSYPAPIEEANLRTIPDMTERFQVICGLSDHTLGIIVPILAVSVGAKVIEKHFILDKSIGGPDVAFSLDKAEFTAMVDAVRNTEKALGNVTYELSEKATKNRIFSRSLFVTKDIKAGEIITGENVRSIRPGYGLPPKLLRAVLGKKAKKDLTKGTPLSWELIDN